MVRVEGRRAALTGTRFDMREKLLERLDAEGITLHQFAQNAGIDSRKLYFLRDNGEKYAKRRAVVTIRETLAALGYTLDDYDPRILRGLHALERIDRALEDGTSECSICRYVGLACHSTLRAAITTYRAGRAEYIACWVATTLAKADCDEFERYAAAHIPEYRNQRGSPVFDEHGERMSFGTGAIECARQLGDAKAGKTLLMRIGGTMLTQSLVKDAAYDAETDKLTFDSATGMYRFEVTRDALVAIWKETGEVSMRREIA